MLNDYGMSNVTVRKDDLLLEMKKNLMVHVEEFLKAQAGYRIVAIKELDAMLEEARFGKPIRRTLTLIEPRNHEADYKRVIRMLEMSVSEVITISETQFQNYVLDEWGWTQEFKGTNSAYGV